MEQRLKKEEVFSLKDIIPALGEQFVVVRDKVPMEICKAGCYKKPEEAAGWMGGISETLQACWKIRNWKTERSETNTTLLHRVPTPAAEVMVACYLFQQGDCTSLTGMRMDARNF